MNTNNNFSELEFIFLDVSKFPFPEESARKWILRLIYSEGHEAGVINFIFCTDNHLLEINQKFLDHDEYTDILTFDYSDDFGNVSGDIYISIDRVKDNAKSFGVEFLYELHRILAHGVLHILGYKDKSVEEKDLMTLKENEYLLLIDFL